MVLYGKLPLLEVFFDAMMLCEMDAETIVSPLLLGVYVQYSSAFMKTMMLLLQKTDGLIAAGTTADVVEEEWKC